MSSLSKNDLTFSFVMSALFLIQFLQIPCVLPWKIIGRMGTHISFQIIDGMFLVFLIKYNAGYRFVIFSLLRFVFVIPSFLKAFYQEGIFNFLRAFFCIDWDDHVIPVIDLCFMAQPYILGINITWSWHIIFSLYFFNVNLYPCCCFVLRQFLYIVLVSL